MVILPPLLSTEETILPLLLVGAVLLGEVVLVLSSSELLEAVVELSPLESPLESEEVVGIDVGDWTELLDDVGLLGWAGESVMATSLTIVTFVDVMLLVVVARVLWWLWTVLVDLVTDVVFSLPAVWERDGDDSSSTSGSSSAESAGVGRMVVLARGLGAGGRGAGAGSRVWTAGASAPLREAWRQSRTPESRSGGSSCLPQSWAGTRSQQRGAKVAAARAVSARLRPRARCRDDSRPVPSALASAPSPRSSPTAAAGSGGAAAGRALGCEQ